MITVAELSVGAYKSPRKDALEKTLKLLSIVNVAAKMSENRMRVRDDSENRAQLSLPCRARPGS